MISTNYIIIDVSEIPYVDFDNVNETSEETLRFSNDGNKTFISWDEESPAFIDLLGTKSQIYSEEEILEIMETSDWKKVL